MSNSPSPPSRTMTDVLSLPDLERSVVNWIMRHSRSTLAQCAEAIEQPATALQFVLPQLVNDGFLRCVESELDEMQQCYEPAVRTRRNRVVPQKIWDALD